MFTPLIKFMVPTRLINISQDLVIKHDRPFLVIRARKQLDHLPPNIFLAHVFDNVTDLMTYRKNSIFKIVVSGINPTVVIQKIDRLLQMLIGRIYKMLMTEIARFKLLRRDLVHSRARVYNCPDLICIEFFPPVQRSRNINIHGNHPHELSVIRPSIPQPFHQVEVVGADTNVLFTS